jgi:hypothetical protein
MRSARLLAVAVLAVVLAVSSAQNVFASTEIAYDDGTFVGSTTANYLGVMFTVTGGASMKLVQIRFRSPQATPYTHTVYVTQSDHTTVITSFAITVTTSGWQTVSVPGGGVAVPQDFFVVLGASSVELNFDAVNDYDRSYVGATLAGMVGYTGGDFLLRAYVDPVSGPVGGIMIPVNTLALVAPWLAVVGLVGCIGTVVVVAKKRRA